MCMVTAPLAGVLGAAPLPHPPTTGTTPAPTGAPRGKDAVLQPSRRQLEDILFDTCAGCLRSQTDNEMSAIPQGVLAVRAVAANNAKKPEAIRSEIAFEHPPLKYNSKLMNSIWGLYNRYSVHNFKKNTDGEASNINFGSQQQVLMTAAAAAPLPGALLDAFGLQ
ncbi:AP-1 complex subunit mu [Frankliniella fusca]|uniref:AP-1 complex subunit mu n=1 Tax=Frankliniella fusca TaxID=407009 RepID=A0AAE1GZ74_9NEOP|nr:AP-1 complex subunit mu [Frankliniella fusca]